MLGNGTTYCNGAKDMHAFMYMVWTMKLHKDLINTLQCPQTVIDFAYLCVGVHLFLCLYVYLISGMYQLLIILLITTYIKFYI